MDPVAVCVNCHLAITRTLARIPHSTEISRVSVLIVY